MALQRRGPKAYSDATVTVAASSLRRASLRTDVTAAESVQLNAIADLLESMGKVIGERERDYGAAVKTP